MRIKEYLILWHTLVCSNEISKSINAYIAKGWQPYGDPFIREGGLIYQAMVKYEEEK